MVEILYDNNNPFSGVSTIPFISRNLNPVNPNERKYLLDSFTLQGQITGACTGDFAYFYDRFNTILNAFKDNFKSLEVLDDGNRVYFAPYSVVRNISVDQNKWYGLIPYSIEIDLYNSGFFSGQYGILDCVDEFSFEDNEDCTISLTHSVRAQGFNTNKSAIQNAIEFVQTRTGWSSQILPNFVGDPTQLILTQVVENSNRFDGSHEIVETYLYDPNDLASPGQGLLKYSLNYDQTENDINVSIEGNLIGGLNYSISQLRNTLNNLDFYEIVSGYNNQYSTGILLNTPSAASIVENIGNNTIDFTFSYSNKSEEDPYLIDNVTIEHDYLEDRICIQFDGTIKSDKICHSGKWQEILDYYNNFDLEAKFNSLWAEYGSGTINWNPTVQSYGENKLQNELTFSVQYCNSNGESFNECIDNFVYNLSFAPAIRMYRENPILNGKGLYCIQDLGYDRRARYSINGTARITNCCTMDKGKNILKSKLNQLSAQYFEGNRKVLESSSITEQPDRVISFDVTWSAEWINIIPNNLK